MRSLPSLFFSFFSHHASYSWQILTTSRETSGPFKSFFCIPNLKSCIFHEMPTRRSPARVGRHLLQRVIIICSFFRWETLNPTSAGWQVASASVFKDPDLFGLIDIGQWCSWKVAGDRIPPGDWSEDEDTRDFQIKIWQVIHLGSVGTWIAAAEWMNKSRITKHMSVCRKPRSI